MVHSLVVGFVVGRNFRPRRRLMMLKTHAQAEEILKSAQVLERTSRRCERFHYTVAVSVALVARLEFREQIAKGNQKKEQALRNLGISNGVHYRVSRMSFFDLRSPHVLEGTTFPLCAISLRFVTSVLKR